VQTVGSLDTLRQLVDPSEKLSIRQQCELLSLCRSGYYYQPRPETPENLDVMLRMDRIHLEWPTAGTRRMTEFLEREGLLINRKRVVRLMRLMGMQAIYPKRSTSQPAEGHRIYPYLLRGVEITGPDQVWSSDITYIPVQGGFLYLVAVMDWWSRYVLSWELSNTMDTSFCIRAWEQALARGNRPPLIHNTDQGSQFTSLEYLDAVESAGVDVSMDGRGRWVDNVFIERLWRSLKYEDVYLQDYLDGLDAGRGISQWFQKYDQQRPHQSLDYCTPEEFYRDPGAHGARPASWAKGRLKT